MHTNIITCNTEEPQQKYRLGTVTKITGSDKIISKTYFVVTFDSQQVYEVLYGLHLCCSVISATQCTLGSYPLSLKYVQ